MPIQVLPILKALAPLIANASGIVAGLRAGSTARTDERVSRLEQETIRVGEVLKGVAEQLQAIAEQLRVQAEITEALQRKARVAIALAGGALGLGLGALIVAFVR